MASHGGGLGPNLKIDRLYDALETATTPAIRERLKAASNLDNLGQLEKPQGSPTTIGDDDAVSRRRARKAVDVKNLNRLLEEEERQAHELRTALKSAGERLAAEADRNETVERKLREIRAREKSLRDARKKAQADAAKAEEQARTYRLHLEVANRENSKAQEAVNALAAERADAEEAAARARSTARRLQEKLLFERARQQGRSEGLEEGLRQGFDEGLDEGWVEGRDNGHDEMLSVFQQALKSGAITSNSDYDVDAAIQAKRANLRPAPDRSYGPSRQSSFHHSRRHSKKHVAPIQPSPQIMSPSTASREVPTTSMPGPDVPPPVIQLTVTSPAPTLTRSRTPSPSPKPFPGSLPNAHPPVEAFPDGFVPTLDESGRIVLPPPHDINPSPSAINIPLPASRAPSIYSHAPSTFRSPRSNHHRTLSTDEQRALDDAAQLRRDKENLQREREEAREELERERARWDAERRAREEEEASRIRQHELERQDFVRENARREEEREMERQKVQQELEERERARKEELELERQRVQLEKAEEIARELERQKAQREMEEHAQAMKLEEEKQRLQREHEEHERDLANERAELERLKAAQEEQAAQAAQAVQAAQAALAAQTAQAVQAEQAARAAQAEHAAQAVRAARAAHAAQDAPPIIPNSPSQEQNITSAEDEEDEEGSEGEEVTTDEPVRVPYPLGQPRSKPVPPIQRRRRAKRTSIHSGGSHKTGQTYRTTGAVSTPLSSFSVLHEDEERRDRIARENKETLRAVNQREKEERDAEERARAARTAGSGSHLSIIHEQPSVSDFNSPQNNFHSDMKQQHPRTPHPANPVLPVRLDRGPPEHVLAGAPTPVSIFSSLPGNNQATTPHNWGNARGPGPNESETALQQKIARAEHMLEQSEPQRTPRHRPITTIPASLAQAPPVNPWNAGPSGVANTYGGASPALPPLPMDSQPGMNMGYQGAPGRSPAQRSSHDRVSSLSRPAQGSPGIIPGSPATSMREGIRNTIPTIHVERPSREGSQTSEMKIEAPLRPILKPTKYTVPNAVSNVAAAPTYGAPNRRKQSPASDTSIPIIPDMSSIPAPDNHSSETSATADIKTPSLLRQAAGSSPHYPSVGSGASPAAHPANLTASSDPPPIIPDISMVSATNPYESPQSNIDPVTADMIPEDSGPIRMQRPVGYKIPDQGDPERLHGSPLRSARRADDWRTPGPDIQPDLPTPTVEQTAFGFPEPSIEPVAPDLSKTPFAHTTPLMVPSPFVHAATFANANAVSQLPASAAAFNGPPTMPVTQTPGARMARPLGSRYDDALPSQTPQAQFTPFTPKTPRMARPLGSTPGAMAMAEPPVEAVVSNLPPTTPKMSRPLATRPEDLMMKPGPAVAAEPPPPATPGRMLRPGMRMPMDMDLRMNGGPPPVVDIVFPNGRPGEVPGASNMPGYPTPFRTGPAFRTNALPFSMTPGPVHAPLGGSGNAMARPSNPSQRPGFGGRGLVPTEPVYPDASRTGTAFRRRNLPNMDPAPRGGAPHDFSRGFGRGFGGSGTPSRQPKNRSPSPEPIIPIMPDSDSGSSSPHPPPVSVLQSPAPIVQPFQRNVGDIAPQASPRPGWTPVSRAGSVKSMRTTRTSRSAQPRKASVHTASGSDEMDSPPMFAGMF